MKRKVSALLTAFILSLAGMNWAWSKDIVEIVVPTAPGGAVDTTARGISRALTERGYENVVTYHPGAGGELALKRVFERRNNVIFVASMANFVFADVAQDRENQPSRTMQLMGPTVTNGMAFFAPPQGQFRTLTSLIDAAKIKEQPCGVSNAHGEIILKQINRQYGTKFTPVMYKGTGPMQPEIIGGHLPCAFDQTAPYTKLGDKVSWLGTSASGTVKEGVPAISTKLPKFEFDNWYASAVPNGSNLLQDKQFVTILRHWSNNKDLAQPLIDQGFVVVPPVSITDLNARADRQTEFYRNLLKK